VNLIFKQLQTSTVNKSSCHNVLDEEEKTESKTNNDTLKTQIV